MIFQVLRGGIMGDANRGDSIQGCGLLGYHLGHWEQQPAAAHTGQLPGRLQDPAQTVLVCETSCEL